MGFLGNIFNDVIDIASAPVKGVSRIVDSAVIGSDLEGFVDDIKGAVKVDKD